jgi:hypothetical protein
MMERLLKRGRQIGAARAEEVAEALVAKPLPPGIRVERISNGITFSGQGLRRRYVTDAALRALLQ